METLTPIEQQFKNKCGLINPLNEHFLKNKYSHLKLDISEYLKTFEDFKEHLKQEHNKDL